MPTHALCYTNWTLIIN